MYDTTLTLKNMTRIWGYAKRKNKRYIPKEGMPHASACQKKRDKKQMHTQRRYATCLGMSKKREKKRQPLIQKERKRQMVHTKEFIHHPPKKSTHLHILIKVYDLFLLQIRSLTQQNMKSRYAFNPPYLQLHKNIHQRQVEEERHNKKPW